MSDIAPYLRLLSADLRRRSPGADHLPGALDDAAEEITRLRAEVERLRMTPAEHEALERAANWLCQAAGDERSFECAATLRDLARRHGPDRMTKAPENVTEPIQEGDA